MYAVGPCFGPIVRRAPFSICCSIIPSNLMAFSASLRSKLVRGRGDSQHPCPSVRTGRDGARRGKFYGESLSLSVSFLEGGGELDTRATRVDSLRRSVALTTIVIFLASKSSFNAQEIQRSIKEEKEQFVPSAASKKRLE